MLEFIGFRMARRKVSAAWPGLRMVVMVAIFGWAAMGFAIARTGQGVVINEIHFNPGKLTGASQREKQEEEFVELYNTGPNEVALDGWRFSRGVEFTFESISIPPGGYLAVAADLGTFRRLHPGVANVVGPFSGQLSNTSEDIELEDASGQRIDLVEYADSGHWAKRESTKLRSYDHWVWSAPHDGSGMSLELIDAARDNAFALAWAPSETEGGSPGRPNTVAKLVRAPLIGDVEHSPAIPQFK